MQPSTVIHKALTIAGSDSGGGAGIQADLKTFQELGVYGMSAITAITAQNTLGVQAVYPMEAGAVAEQLRSLGDDLPPDAVKTGMLAHASIITAVAEQMAHYRFPHLVIDPVMIAKGGTSLLQREALSALVKELIPLSFMITPNVPEAEELTGMSITSLSDREEAALRLHQMGSDYVMLKGGHDPSTRDLVVDMLYDGTTFRYWEHRRIDTRHTHGTGCTFSAAITAGLAQGMTAYEAVDLAKAFIHAAIEHSFEIGAGQGPTNHFAYRLYHAD
ncbi:bifunctional hydroxymethylpyrimidine kinase/phosphomethylpyrimidine kinase [Paenibacillus sp. 1011MAR3C5]|uniref:bifunctional hydroxymethylpyrimidine kinase/phosphomethylpyrimidine kinase n=1 Tax=Paenibacillus sp. 1011MAR3C5 TaxID=1675787 RepID=UPI000E6D251C|nr:bifunctional hydroxymethylpyrimidine kinase/phosphomethylpyrimidine kinase [Paenibacillus sp. 1011MAR3C5]RJE87587.1 bifunctional hydroxymethylpyrimidine kinase/phosphomethylpyrimidine kinase [Paenibacillus sp. 1011MAR3C5]